MGIGREAEEGVTSIERFKRFLQETPEKAGMLVKRWIKIKMENERLGLSIITSTLESSELAEVFQFIDETEKEEWSAYTIEDGTRMRVKLVVVDVIRLDVTNDATGEPVYVVKSQTILNPDVPDVLKVKSGEPDQTH